MRRRRGVSLAEVLVAMFVGALLMTGVTQVFVVGWHVFKYSSAQGDVQTAGLIGMGTLTRELRASSSTVLTVTSPNPTVLAFRVQDSSATAMTGFTPAQQFIIYWMGPLGGGNYQCLWRQVWNSNDPNWKAVYDNSLGNPFIANRQLTSTEAVAATGGVNSSKRMMARYVQSMSVTPANYPTNGAFTGITVTLVAQEFFNSTESVQQTYSETLNMRNSTCWALPTPTPTPSP